MRKLSRHVFLLCLLLAPAVADAYCQAGWNCTSPNCVNCYYYFNPPPGYDQCEAEFESAACGCSWTDYWDPPGNMGLGCGREGQCQYGSCGDIGDGYKPGCSPWEPSAAPHRFALNSRGRVLLLHRGHLPIVLGSPRT